ncbi:MAG: membrane protein insertase YidC [Proteobacteria bacterium]|nr:membrane protein insertase YidC [Pseudomonadota bacterium]
MQDQGKRLLLAVAAALGVLLLFQFVFPHKEEPKPAAGSGSGSGAATATSAVPPEKVRLDVGPCHAAQAEAAPAPRGPEQFLDVNYPGHFSAKFSSYGGELVSWKLADPRFGNDATKGELLPDHTKFAEYGAFGLNFTCDSTFHLPLASEWKGELVSPNELKYTWPATPSATDVFSVEKLYKIDPDSFSVRMTAKIAMKLPAGKEAYQTLVMTAFESQDPKTADKGSSSQTMARAWHSAAYRDGAVTNTSITDMIKDRPDGMVRHARAIRWSGFEHPYLLVAFAPHPDGPTSLFEKFALVDNTSGLMADAINFPRVTVKAGDAAVTHEVYAYLGPKNYKDLERADDVAGFESGFKATIDLGWFAFIGRPLMWLLLKFQSVVGNWGLAIILLTFLVKGATLFWTTKSMRSMKAMAALGPQMKALQAKYADDKQRLQAETMALYKVHGVNPIAGCLPILLQMPIWLALYRMLSTAGELYQQPFITGWINDLTAPDPSHVLPAILVVTMFVQARLTPATGDSTQQKVMQYGMPLMFGVMSFFFPAGLTLYIFTNTLLSALHSVYMNKYDKKSLAIAAQMKANAEKLAQEAAVEPKGGKKAPAPATPAPKKPVNGTSKSSTSSASAESDSDPDESEESDEPATSAAGSVSGTEKPRRRKKKQKR